ncbi:MAG: phosphodiester glycosidase family protein [Deltaproteobacteria bacterium]|nr:phosphodiester glycosidase family protein [Deltaproteobacteria bacterium]
MLILGSCSSASSTPIAFEHVAPGVEAGAFSERGDPAFGGHAFIVDLSQVDLTVVHDSERKRVSELSARWPQHLAINASFFDPRGHAMGRVVDAGRVLNKERQARWGALVVDHGHARVVAGDTLAADAPGGELVVQGVPRLVVDGAVQKLKPAAAERTAVCAEGSSLVLVVTTAPADATGFARFLARPRAQGGLGCTQALNLDGGPSTQLNARLGGYKLGIDGGWGVPNALVVLPKSASHEPTPAPPADAGAGGASDAGAAPVGATAP